MNIHVPYDGHVQLNMMQYQDDLEVEMPTVHKVAEDMDSLNRRRGFGGWEDSDARILTARAQWWDNFLAGHRGLCPRLPQWW